MNDQILNLLSTLILSPQLEEEEGADEIVKGEEDEGEDSEREDAGPVAEGMLGDEEGGPDDLVALVASGAVETFYAGPTPRQMRRWRRHGSGW